MAHDGRLGHGLVGAVDTVDDSKELALKSEDYDNFMLYDSLSGKELPKEVTVKARQTTMRQVYAHKFYDKVPLQRYYDATGTKWLEMNNEDVENYNIRARSVAQEFTKGKLENIFAAMPSWEAKKMLLSLATTEGIGYGPGWHYKICFRSISKEHSSMRPPRQTCTSSYQWRTMKKECVGN